jgi:hypothetical protein
MRTQSVHSAKEAEMSQTASPQHLAAVRRIPRAAWVVLGLAAAAAAVALVLALSGGGNGAGSAAPVVRANPAVRYDGGPEEGSAAPNQPGFDWSRRQAP